MNLYTPDQIAQLVAEFPTCDVPGTLQRIEDRSADEPIRHPMALARSWLRRDAEESAAPAKPDRPRGTLRPDGSWWAEAKHPSPTDNACRDLHALVLRTLVSPRDAVPMIRANPLLIAAYREDNLRDMLNLDASPKPCLGGPYAELAWADAAWAGVPTSTTAEEMVKHGLIRRWREQLIALYHPELAAIRELETKTQAEYDDFPDNGSAW
jgi:hypothetical protein